MPKISVIVCTKDRAVNLQHFIGSLLTQREAVYELIIADASIEDIGIKDLCASLLQDKNIVYKYVHTMSGSAYQRNIGISLLAYDSEYVCFFDDDVIMFEDTIQNMMLAFQEHGEAGAVQGVEVNAQSQNPVIRIFKSIFFMGHAANRWALLPSGENAIVLKPSRDIVIGSLMTGYCLKRKVVDEFKFDEWFTGYSFLEDYDFSFRISKGYKMVQVPSARFIHNAKGIGALGAIAMSRMRIVNKYYFFNKNMVKTPVTILAFYWSLMGHLIFNLSKSIFRMDPAYITGTLQGLVVALSAKKRYG